MLRFRGSGHGHLLPHSSIKVTNPRGVFFSGYRPFGFFRTISTIFGIIIGIILTLMFVNIFSPPVAQSPQYVREPQAAIEDDFLANELKDRVRILCFVFTGPDMRFKKKSVAVKETWGRRCNEMLFFSSHSDDEIPTIKLSSPEGKVEKLWNKTQESFKYVYENYRGTYDWVLKADDNSYVIVENLRYMLKDIEPKEPIAFGQKVVSSNKNGGNTPVYMTGGAGFVLSEEAVRRFVNEGIPGRCDSKRKLLFEDVEMGDCLQKLGVKLGDSKDHNARPRFSQVSLLNLIDPETTHPNNNWIKPRTKGMECCSTTAVSFHDIDPPVMYLYEILLYRMNIYGITRRGDSPDEHPVFFPGKPPKELDWFWF